MWYFAVENGLLKNGSVVVNSYVAARAYTADCSRLLTMPSRFERTPGANTMSTGDAANQIWASPQADSYPARQPARAWSALTLLGSFSPVGRSDLKSIYIDEYPYGDTTTAYVGRLCCSLAVASTSSPVGTGSSPVGTGSSTPVATGWSTPAGTGSSPVGSGTTTKTMTMVTSTSITRPGDTTTTTTTRATVAGETTTTMSRDPAATTATAANGSDSTGATGAGFQCPTLPADVLDLALGCRADLKQFRVDCKTAVPLPDAKNKIGSFNSLAVTLSRCPSPEVSLDVVYELALPNAVSLAAKTADIDVPSGPQTLTLKKGIDTSDIEVPVWPQTGIVVIPKSALSAERKVGIALVIAKPTINGASITFGLNLRVCAALAMCIDVPIAANQSFGFEQVCCIPDALQCADEFQRCHPTTTITTLATPPTNDVSGAQPTAIISSLAIVVAIFVLTTH